MIIPIQENQKHKYIKVRARACSVCGAKSEWIEKLYYIDCNTLHSLPIMPSENKTLVHKRDDNGNISLLPSVYIAYNEECLHYYYEISDTEYKEVTLSSKVSTDRKLSIIDEIGEKQNKLFLSVRAFCTRSETWKSEQFNIFYNIEKDFMFTPFVFSSTGDFSTFTYLQKGDYVRLCIPSVNENAKIKYTIDGSEPTQSNEYGEIVGDYIEQRIFFDKIGDYEIRVVMVLNGRHSAEFRKTIKVREAIVIQSDTNAVLSSDNGNILGDFLEV